MLESQFYLRLVITALLGVLFVYAMINLAKSNPMPDTNGRHLGRKIIGSLFLLISAVAGIASIIYICNITFPEEMLGQPFSANMIFREVGTMQHWGYPTTEQQMSISLLTGLFAFLSFAGYFFCYKKSRSNWWKRTLKVLLIFLTYMFYVSSTDWHYFDIHEFTATILYAVCIGIIFKISQEKAEINNATSEQPLINNIEDLPNVSEDTSKSSSTLTQQTDKEFSNAPDIQTVEDRYQATRKTSLEQVKIIIENVSCLIGNFIKRTLGMAKFRIAGVIIGTLILVIGGVLLYVSIKSYPDYIESFGDKWKYTFNISNDPLARKLILRANDEKSNKDFLFRSLNGDVVICDARYFYEYIDQGKFYSEVKTFNKQIFETDNIQFKSDLYDIDPQVNSYYNPCTLYDYLVFDSCKESELYTLFCTHNILLDEYNVDEYMNNFESWINDAAEIYTNNVETTKKIVSYYCNNNNLNRAENAYKFAISNQKNNPELLGLLSYIQFKNNNLDEAETSARKAIKLNNTETNAATTLSMLYAYKSDWMQTVKWSKVAIDYDTELPEAYYMYSAGSYNLGDKKIAKEYYNKAHNLDPENIYAGKYEECGGCPIECIMLEHGFTKEGGEIVTDYGKKLQSSKSRYLSTRMEANAFRTGQYSFDIKVYENGKLSTGDTRVDEGYSYNTMVNISDIGRCTLKLGGWGSNTPGTWSSGRYRVEVWYKGELVDDNIFRIE